MNNTAELEIKTSVQLVLIEAANLSIEDEFLKYEPQTEEEKFLKEELTNVISNGIKNFWTTIYNPYYSENMKKIYFVDNEKATTGRSFEWWKKNARTIHFFIIYPL